MTEHESESSPSDSQAAEHGGGAVVAEYDSFDDLLNRCASKISEEGLEVEMDSATDLGSTMRFDLRIRDGFPVLVGEGEVVRVQEVEEGDFSRFTVALRFLHLDQPSLKLLPRLIEHYRKQGVALLELPAAGMPLTTGETTDEPQGPPATLTLLDLEEEFSESDQVAVEENLGDEREAERSGDEAPEEPLVDAEAMIEAEEPTEKVSVDVLDEDEIRVEDLMSVGDVEAESEVLEVPSEFEGPPLDPGLPWLPDDAESKKSGDFWLILLLAIAGALLGAGFYYLYLNSSESSRSETPSLESLRVASQAEPTSEAEPGQATTVTTESVFADVVVPVGLLRVTEPDGTQLRV